MGNFGGGFEKIWKMTLMEKNKEMSLLKWVCGHMDMVLILLNHMHINILLYTTLSLFLLFSFLFSFFLFWECSNQSNRHPLLVGLFFVPNPNDHFRICYEIFETNNHTLFSLSFLFNWWRLMLGFQHVSYICEGKLHYIIL